MKAGNVMETDVLKRGHNLHYALPFFPMPKPSKYMLSQKDMIVAMVCLNATLLGNKPTFSFIRGRLFKNYGETGNKVSFQKAIAPLLTGTDKNKKLLNIEPPAQSDPKKKKIDILMKYF